MTAQVEEHWQLYIIECDDGSFYTGITNNMINRFASHNSGKGAKYFRRCKPVQVVYQELALSRSEAAAREYAVKRLTRKQKIDLIRRAECLG